MLPVVFIHKGLHGHVGGPGRFRGESLASNLISVTLSLQVCSQVAVGAADDLANVAGSRRRVVQELRVIIHLALQEGLTAVGMLAKILPADEKLGSKMRGAILRATAGNANMPK